MVKFCLLIVLFCSSFCYIEAQSSKDSSGNKIVDRFVAAISKNCTTNDSSSQELSNLSYQYLIEIKNIRNTISDRMIRAQKRVELQTVFERELKQKFGKCVHKNYMKIIGVRQRDRMWNKITGRTSE